MTRELRCLQLRCVAELRLGFSSAEASAAVAFCNQLSFSGSTCTVVKVRLRYCTSLKLFHLSSKALLDQHGRTCRHLNLHARAVMARNPSAAVDDLLAASQPPAFTGPYSSALSGPGQADGHSVDTDSLTLCVAALLEVPYFDARRRFPSKCVYPSHSLCSLCLASLA